MKSITKILTALLLFAAFFTITSCSDDDAVSTNSKCINPPSWIWGSWGFGDKDLPRQLVIFEKNYYATGNTMWTLRQGELTDANGDCLTGLTVTEPRNSDTEYEWVMKGSGLTVSRLFEKGDGTFITEITGSTGTDDDERRWYKE